MLGERYRNDGSSQEDLAAACEWYLKAAMQEHSGAQNNYGSMVLNGMGIQASPEEAVVWYQRAAYRGHPEAQFNLGMRYLHGSGVTQDSTTAAKWIIRAALQGHTEATGQLGTLYRFGDGVELDLVHASVLHVHAAMDGDVTSIGNLQDYAPELDGVAGSGSIVAACNMAKIMRYGLAGVCDQQAARQWIDYAYTLIDSSTPSEILDQLQEMRAETGEP